MITEITACPQCKSANIKKQTWRPAGPYYRPDTRKTLDKFGINCIVEFVCGDCGFIHRER